MPIKTLNRPKAAPAVFANIFPDILTLIADGHSLNHCTRKLHFSKLAFYNWLDSPEANSPELDARNCYARAREYQAETMADEIVDLRDKATPENAHTVRVKIDARRWIAAKLKPRVYGERPPDLNVMTNIQAVVFTEEKARELQERLKRLRAADETRLA
jgi:hypothetical protein